MEHPNMVGRFSWRDALLFGIVIALTFAIWQGGQSRQAAYKRADHSACVRIENLKVGFVVSLERAQKALDSYTYYKQHPLEKQKALDEMDREIAQYAPVSC